MYLKCHQVQILRLLDVKQFTQDSPRGKWRSQGLDLSCLTLKHSPFPPSTWSFRKNCLSRRKWTMLALPWLQPVARAACQSQTAHIPTVPGRAPAQPPPVALSCLPTQSQLPACRQIWWAPGNWRHPAYPTGFSSHPPHGPWGSSCLFL